MGPSLQLSRVVALVGGLALVAAFFMPWFASQNLLLSGQFLHTFLSAAAPADVQRFIPGSTPAEVQALRVLVDLFPVLGAVAAVLSLVSLPYAKARLVVDGLLALTALIALLAWAGGVTRLPPGSRWEVGVWLIAVASLAVVLGAALDVVGTRRSLSTRPQGAVA